MAELDPADEQAHLALMRRQAANGERHAALRQFDRLDRALRQELGIAPGPEATALRDRLLAAQQVFPRRDGPLLGRDLELAIAGQALRDASAGQGQTLIVTGPAGQGKSSLLEAITARAAELGMACGHGTSAAVEGAWPYAPVIEALGGLGRDDPALLSGMAAGHREQLDRARAGIPAGWVGESTHQRLFAAAAELVSTVAAARGLLLTVDDVHEADDASLRLLHYLARSARGQRVCIVLAHRPAPLPDALAQLRTSLTGRYGAAEMHLGPLGSRDAEALIRCYLAEPPAELAELIAALGHGNPFMLTELARRAAGLDAAGLDAAGTGAAGPGWAEVLEASLLAGLRPGTREVLQRVAVAGACFDTDEFIALSGLGEEEAFGRLDDALAAHLVEPAASGYRFRHCLIREALTRAVPAHRRRQIHRDTADRLIGLRASPARIGHHLLAGGAVADAMPQLLQAAETAAALGAYREALALADTVRAHATGPDRTRALSLRADLLTAIGDPMAGPAYREALGEPLPPRPGGCGPGWRTAPSWRATWSPRRRRWLASTPTAPALMTPTSGWREASTRSSPPTSTRPGPRPIRRSGSSSRGPATGRCWTWSRCGDCSRTIRVSGSPRWEPSCTGPGRIRGWRARSSTGTCARPSTCCTGRRRTPRSSS